MYGIRTIAGLGSWEGWVTSEEYLYCKHYGYHFEILKGYKFDKKIIFKEYVEKLYQMRMEYAKSNPLNLVAKLLMNSLYGKFGMKSESTMVEIYDSRQEHDKKMVDYLLEHTGEFIQDLTQIGHYYLIQTVKSNFKNNEKEDVYHGLDVLTFLI